MRPRLRRSTQRNSRKSNKLNFQTLEPRRLLAGDSGLPAFSPDAGLYQIFSNYGRVGQVDLESRTFDVADSEAGTKVNAAGFRTSDNYAYGVVVSVGEIARIGSNGEIEVLGSVDGLPMNKGTYFVGDFANDDLLYLRNSGEKNKLYGVNVDTMAVDNVIVTSEALNNIYDIGFNNVDEKFYASQRGAENKLISIDLDGQVELIGSNGLSKLTFGAMYADANGSVFGGANQTGDVYRFSTTTGEATLVGKGPTSGSNDGFSNAAQILELAPIALDDMFVMDGHQTTYNNLFTDTGNGSDVDGNDDPFYVSAVNGDSSAVGSTVNLDTGTLVVMENGDFIFKPSAENSFLKVGESATATFSYSISDDYGTSHGDVEITVNGTIETNEIATATVYGLSSFGGSASQLLVAVGDINGDGFVDGVASVPGASHGKGATFLIYGNENGFQQNFDVNDLRYFNGNNGDLGTIFLGAANNDFSGYSFSDAGDFNGDGIDDLLIGAKDADANGIVNSGQAYLIFGNNNGFGAEFSLASLLGDHDGSQGMVVHGTNAHDLTGEMVTSIGDLNDDGFADFALGVAHADVDSTRKNAGQTFVIFGNDRQESELNLRSLRSSNGGDGLKGFVLNGVRKHDLSGGFVNGGEDLNGDGLADLLLTARNADAKGLVDAGQSYVVFGSDRGFNAEIELADLLTENGGDGGWGFAVNGHQRSKHLGSFVDFGKDMNGDGIAELMIGIGNDNESSSTTGIIFGGNSSFGHEVSTSSYDSTPVFLDNIENPTEYGKAWDNYTYSATLFNDNGTQVTIWGDPHVVINVNGQVETFDIGYGEGVVQLSGGVEIRWETYQPDSERFPLGPPLKYFTVDSIGSEFDITVELGDYQDSMNNLTSLNELQLQEFAAQLRLLEGDASKPLGT